MTTAIIVGSGPNGLAAAITLAQRGVKVRVVEAKDTIGGGTRSHELTLPGLIHDDCSAFHPTGAASPFLRTLRLEEHGLTWLWPEIDLAHPLDGGRAAVLWRDIDRTAACLGADGPSWLRLFGPLSRSFDDLTDDVFQPVIGLPSHPVKLGVFGVNALLPASLMVRRWETAEARALFGGVAAHAFAKLNTPLSSAVGLMLIAAAHAYGWPVAKGGSSSISEAMASKLRALGGMIETGFEVTSARDLGDADLVMLDTSPDAVLRIVGERMPARIKRSYRHYRYGPAAFKVDFAIEGEVPWANEHVRRAGTVHLGGSFDEIAAAERQAVRGVMPVRPTVLVGQQFLADPSRSAGGMNPLWTYAHVPHGYSGDATEAVIAQIERFAPGFRGRIRKTFVRNVADMESYNANYIGGDISAGANTPKQVLLRPRIAVDPYATGIPGVYLCSSATPPGAGVHGMCGHNAAMSALREKGIS